MSDARTIERLLRCYPPAWRDRYGTELASLLEEGRLRWRVRLDVVRGGLVQRLRGSGLIGDDLPAGEHVRAGVLLVLCAWSVFVVAGCAFGKFSEHWQAVTPDESRGVPAAAFNVLLLTAEIGTVAALFGIAASLAAFVAFLRGGGWPSIRSHILRAAIATGVTLALSGGLVFWAHQLTDGQRNGEDWLYGSAFVLSALLIFASIGLWTAAAVAAAQRIRLAPSRLRLEARIAFLVTTAMVVMTVAALVWWWSAPSVASVQMSVITLTMVFATALAVTGSARSLRAIRRSL